MAPRWTAALTLTWLLLGTGCSIPCSKVRSEVDGRYAALPDEVRRSGDPGGDRYDLTLTIPADLLDASFQHLVDAGAIETRHELSLDVPLPDLSGGMEVRFRVDLKEMSFQPVAGEPARVQAHAVLRLRGNASEELFDLTATVDGPVELFTRAKKGQAPALMLRIGDLEGSEIALQGSFLGQALATELEGLVPRGAIGNLLGSIGVDVDLLRPLEEAFEKAARKHTTTAIHRLLADTVGDVQVLEVGPLGMGDLQFVPTGVGLLTGDGWVALGLRTDLDAGRGALRLGPPAGRPRGKVQVQASEPFIGRAVQLAYLQGMIPRSFDDQGRTGPDGPNFVEPLGVRLQATPQVGVRVSRCDEPCGWAELWADLDTSGAGAQEMAITVGDVRVERSKGAGKLVELVLWHQEKVMGEPVQFVQQVSRVFTPTVGDEPLELRINRVSTGDGTLTLSLGYQLAPVATPANRPSGGRKPAGTGRRKR
jgi:hypothetical protein